MLKLFDKFRGVVRESRQIPHIFCFFIAKNGKHKKIDTYRKKEVNTFFKRSKNGVFNFRKAYVTIFLNY
jgi:hypothetical protein